MWWMNYWIAEVAMLVPRLVQVSESGMGTVKARVLGWVFQLAMGRVLV